MTSMYIQLPTIDLPLIVTFGFTLAFFAAMHLVLKAGFLLNQDIPRTVAYALGLAGVGLPWTFLTLARADAAGAVLAAQTVFDFWVIVLAAAIPTVLLRLLKDYMDMRAERRMRRARSEESCAGDKRCQPTIIGTP